MFVSILTKPSEGSIGMSETSEYQTLDILGLNDGSECDLSRIESAMLVYGVLM
jgi:hypothetical protein